MSLEGNIILKHLGKFNESLKDELVRKNINDTNNAMDSLREEQKDEKTFQSIGSDYVEFLDRGRRPGSFAPVANIQDWVKSKLGITDEIQMKQIAFLVNRKIAKEGTAIFKNNSKGLEIDEKIPKFREKLVDELKNFAVVDVKKKLDLFKTKSL